jgi:DNA-binding MarR family transcriptional regulator
MTSPQGGGMVKAAWFRSYAANERPEKFDRVVQSWDTANKASELSDFSVCTSWGIKGKDLYLLHVLRKRMEYPELKRAVRQQRDAFEASVVLIEDKASGTQEVRSTYYLRMTKPTKTQIDTLRVGIDNLVRRFKIAEAGPAVEGALKLNPIDVQALLFIADHPGCTASVVAQHLGVVATTTSALLDRLVRHGLVLRERVDSNRRIVRLSLRAAGQERVKRLIETANAHCRAMLEVLAPEERACFVEAVIKITSSIS